MARLEPVPETGSDNDCLHCTDECVPCSAGTFRDDVKILPDGGIQILYELKEREAFLGNESSPEPRKVVPRKPRARCREETYYLGFDTLKLRCELKLVPVHGVHRATKGELTWQWSDDEYWCVQLREGRRQGYDLA